MRDITEIIQEAEEASSEYSEMDKSEYWKSYRTISYLASKIKWMEFELEYQKSRLEYANNS